MSLYLNQKLVECLQREAGIYSGDVEKLFLSYVQTSKDLLTIENNSVRAEIIEVLDEKRYNFRNHVPRNVRKEKHISELMREVDCLVRENI